MNASLSVKKLLEAIASLSPDERRDLFLRLGVVPISEVAGPRATQFALLAEFAPNTLEGEADHVVMFDGGSEGNPGHGYGSFSITTAGEGNVIRLDLGDLVTSNEAEYATLIHALDSLTGRIESESRLLQESSVEVRGDSALVLNQVSGEWKAKDRRMREMRDSVRHSLNRFKAHRLTRVPRSEMVKAFGH